MAANSVLRGRIEEGAATRGIRVVVPRPGLCTDNAAMIGAAGFFRARAGARAGADLAAKPSLKLAVPQASVTQPRPRTSSIRAGSPRRESSVTCKRHGLAARKSRSQNHLVDGQMIEDIVALAEPAVGSQILEIGPGLGVLTGALLARRGARDCSRGRRSRFAAHLRTRYEPEIAAER